MLFLIFLKVFFFFKVAIIEVLSQRQAYDRGTLRVPVAFYRSHLRRRYFLVVYSNSGERRIMPEDISSSFA